MLAPTVVHAPFIGLHALPELPDVPELPDEPLLVPPLEPLAHSAVGSSVPASASQLFAFKQSTSAWVTVRPQNAPQS